MSARQDAGFSLVEIMVALGLSVLVGLGAAYLLLDTFRWSNNAAIQADMDHSHILASQVARNSKNLEDWMNTQVPIVLTPARRLCFSRSQSTDVNCASLWSSGAAIELIGARKSWSSGGYDVVSQVTVSAQCLLTSCSSMNVEISTKLMKDGVALDGKIPGIGGSVNRKTIFNIPSYMFGADKQIRFDCSNFSGLRRVVTGVETDYKDARCDTLKYIDSCAPSTPFGGFSSNRSYCVPLNVSTQTKCPLGYAVAGILKDSNPNAVCIEATARNPATMTASCAAGTTRTINSCVNQAFIDGTYATWLSAGYVPVAAASPCPSSCATPGEVPICKRLQCPL